MEHNYWSIAFTVGVASACWLALKYYRNTLPLPPSPPGHLLLGHARMIPPNERWKTLYRWSQEFASPVVYFRIFRRRFIVLNTYKAASDLLDTRSKDYSDRPSLVMLHELIGRKLDVFAISARNPRFKMYRRLLNDSLNPRALLKYRNIQTEETHTMLRGLLDEPGDYIRHFRRNAGGVILKVAYGWTVTGNNDRFVTAIEKAAVEVAAVVRPGRWLVDTFPLLRFVPSWFPGTGFKRMAKELRVKFARLEQEPHTWAMEQIMAGDYVKSFTSHHMCPDDGHQPDAEQEDIIRWCSGALYAGGAHTTVSILTSFVLRMLLHPDVQRRAQLEIDTVVGTDRLPSWDDEPNLPYVSALVKEVMRVAPSAPMGIPHVATREDNYMGYRISKGATVIANIWAMTHDSTVYPEPFRFNPDRFYKGGDMSQPDPDTMVFGFGRRICPGRYMAKEALFMNIACILACFDILHSGDENHPQVGTDEMSLVYTSGIVSHPEPFKCSFTPRASRSLDVLDS